MQVSLAFALGLTLTCVTLICVMPAHAQDDFFSEVELPDELDNTNEPSEGLNGYFRQSIQYGLDDPDQSFPFARDKRGLSTIQSELFGEYAKTFNDNAKIKLSGKLEVDWLEWNAGDQKYRPNREKFFLQDAYLDYTPSSSFWLRAGHQVFAWGESEGLAVTDILSPRDLREPGQAQLRDIREPVPAIMVSNAFGKFDVSAVLTYEAGQNRYAQRNQDFYPYITQARFFDAFTTRDPEKNWEFALRLDYQFNGGDIAFIAGEVNDNDPVPVDLQQGSFGLRVLQQQERQQIFGVSLNKVWGSWLLKSELADYAVDEITEFSADQDQQRAMLGFEYSGITDLLLSFEINVTHFDREAEPGFAETGQESVFYGGVVRLRHSAINARWINQLWLLSLAEEGEIARWQSSWDWSDILELGFSLTLYDSSSSDDLLFAFRKNHSAEISARWNF